MAASEKEAEVGVQSGLRAGVLGKVLLTGLGVSYIVAGNYAAWGFGLGRGGWGGLPPLVITTEQIDTMFDITHEALDATLREV